jgi:ribonuclease HI
LIKKSKKIKDIIMKKKIIIYTDGGSRGNPGPAGIGGVIKTYGLSLVNNK